MKKLNKYYGFTLVEMVIVIAIIGILLGIAVPNIRKYQVDASDKSLKSQASMIYNAAKSVDIQDLSILDTKQLDAGIQNKAQFLASAIPQTVQGMSDYLDRSLAIVPYNINNAVTSFGQWQLTDITNIQNNGLTADYTFITMDNKGVHVTFVCSNGSIVRTDNSW